MKKRRRLLAVGILFLAVLAGWATGGEASGHPSERILDQADLLTDREESRLSQLLDRYSQENQCDIVAATVDSLGNKTAQEAADDLFDEKGYGTGTERDGILLLVSMERRDWAISTSGFAMQAFSLDGQTYIMDQVKPLLGEEEYFQAFQTYANLSAELVEQAREGNPYGEGKSSGKPVPLYWIPVSIILGMGLAWVFGRIRASALKSVTGEKLAARYIVPKSFHLTVRQDQLIRKFVTTRRIEKSGSGSGAHTSSSGRTHGGSNGKF